MGSRLVNGDKLLGLLISPDAYPRRVWVENSMAAIQDVIGGGFEVLMPFQEPMVVIAGEEGKPSYLPVNGMFTDEDGRTVHIIVGNMLILGVERNAFCSLTERQIQAAEMRLQR